MPWNVLGIVGLLTLWAACGLLPWCVQLVARRGEGVFASLPLAIMGGMAGGLLVAAFAKAGIGFAGSIPAALMVGGAATVAVGPLVRSDSR